MDLKKLFAPQRIAIVGVSFGNDRHPANVVYNKNRLRYPIEVFPVNPKGGVLQRRQIYQRVADIPEPVDLAVIAVRAAYAPAVLEECISAGVGAAVVISGGFAESGRKDLQDQMASMAIAADLPLIGPNCLGIFAPGHFDTFFLPVERMVQPGEGNVALVSQSGGILVDQMINFAGEGIGLSLAFSIGNKAVINEVALLDHLAALFGVQA